MPHISKCNAKLSYLNSEVKVTFRAKFLIGCNVFGYSIAYNQHMDYGIAVPDFIVLLF